MHPIDRPRKERCHAGKDEDSEPTWGVPRLPVGEETDYITETTHASQTNESRSEDQTDSCIEKAVHERLQVENAVPWCAYHKRRGNISRNFGFCKAREPD